MAARVARIAGSKVFDGAVAQPTAALSYGSTVQSWQMILCGATLLRMSAVTFPLFWVNLGSLLAGAGTYVSEGTVPGASP
jgi:hypothetical protein